MIRSIRNLVPAAVLLLAACGGGDDHSAAVPPDSANMVKAASAVPGPLGGVPAAAQAGVDSSNAAAARRNAEVDSLANQASGGSATP
jgi:hypothetical protein